jgi:hypothetical protein
MFLPLRVFFSTVEHYKMLQIIFINGRIHHPEAEVLIHGDISLKIGLKSYPAAILICE